MEVDILSAARDLIKSREKIFYYDGIRKLTTTGSIALTLYSPVVTICTTY
jgi:hypothetical protein